MDMKYVYKEKFSVLGKLGQGAAENPWSWIKPLWDDANGNFTEIEGLAIKNNGKTSIWGIMSDLDENFNRWDDKAGKYLACCEVKEETAAPVGWVKWDVPSQTYIVAASNQEEYLSVFHNVINDFIPKNNLKLIGAVHEHYPDPGNPDIVELYFPIAKGSYFCQSCGMPMISDEDRGDEKDLSKSQDYCRYCYEKGEFTSNDTMEDMINSCVPFTLEAGVYPDEKTARDSMLTYFPELKRWKQA
ncbi:zinc ribbon domain-containing protein [Anaerocolumna sp. MB42-C2]|uniref:zinc ribbon domain-containing protein n=1 Tax=Anaerocolumna sp. MB42-C2 TaxID=3070997 RepID=UPI0027DF0885|nr:zinc ribbon domain-containing protein [Anaerocolumna sp. MB42-C2]WMJ89377.1 zinc ribbon domain-containing protein [Anaerocolumna sp. MB42-C2]